MREPKSQYANSIVVCILISDWSLTNRQRLSFPAVSCRRDPGAMGLLLDSPSIVLWIRLLVVTFFLIFLHIVRFFIRVIAVLLPFSGWLDGRSRAAAAYLSQFLRSTSDPPPIESTLDSAGLIAHYGYPVEEHAVRTPDGYVLGVQRIPRGRRDTHDPAVRRPSVLLLHGLMMSSEVWLLNKESSLPFLLADAGYDVWLGNVRGNKHSLKHATLSPNSEAFWNYSLDELARHDLPSMVDYALLHSGNAQIGYIGFSNGTATMFAALSHRLLADKIRYFVALSPAVTLRGITSSGANALIEAGLDFVYLLFGTKQMLPIATFYTSTLSTSLLIRIMDLALLHIFSWTTSEIDHADKKTLYYHFYSYTSVKSIVHWFQIMRAGRFQMYDDAQSAHGRPPRYDISHIDMPIALFHGGKDTLIDANLLIESLNSVRTCFFI